MQFINIVVHSVENMNFRVHLQYEFTQLGLDQYLEVSPDYLTLSEARRSSSCQSADFSSHCEVPIKAYGFPTSHCMKYSPRL